MQYIVCSLVWDVCLHVTTKDPIATGKTVRLFRDHGSMLDHASYTFKMFQESSFGTWRVLDQALNTWCIVSSTMRWFCYVGRGITLFLVF